ncbi:MAG: hypothetical protein OCC46_14760 [Pseudodesulfovibrio sp.]
MLQIKLTIAAIAIVIGVAITLPFMESGANAAPGNQKLCPVMGFEITKELFTDFDGKRIFFCCSSCPPDFKETPDKFMEQLRKHGVILEDAPA